MIQIFRAALTILAVTGAHAQLTETVLHNFASPPKGANPYGNLIRDSAGNLYGTTEAGGQFNAGTVFRLSAAGKITVLYSFTGGADGREPEAGLYRDSSGNLYGTTYYGGTAGDGVIFQVTPAGIESVLYTFKGGADGANPGAGLIRDSAGNFYGTTASGGASHSGVVYMLNPAGVQTVLYTFTGQGDGSGPQAIIRDSAGNLYGTTRSGGAAFAGVVFKVDTTGKETVLYPFQDGFDGGYPCSGLARDSAGNLYGTTNEGGSLFSGVVFEITTAGQEMVLYTFSGGADGSYPQAGVTLDSAGNLYGTTSGGGLKAGFAGYGVVYRLNPANHQEAVLYTFPYGTPGGAPTTGVITDAAGNVYGTAAGGAALLGVVYKVDTTGTESVLYSFAGPLDGNNPRAGLIRDTAGNLYGTTDTGGTFNRGVVFKLSPSGTAKTLYTFTGGSDGAYPFGGLVRDTAGNFYGAASGGGTGNNGVIFKLTAAGVESVLYTFTGAGDGSAPSGTLVRDSAGNLYGTAGHGGSTSCFSGCGVVFKVTPGGTESVLYTFNGTAGAYPLSGVIRDSAGNLYGTASGGGPSNYGNVFKISAAGVGSVLYSFTGGSDGGMPSGGLVRDAAGNLYGAAELGGTSFFGVVYGLNTAGKESVLYNFTGQLDGGLPYGSLIRDSSGNLFGATQFGGGAGVIYELSPAGEETILYTFSGTSDGGRSYAGLLEDTAGNLYGTASAGGTQASGVVFELTP